MKSSDLKVIAIILSVALLFTIITSNAVSIASVVMLAKGGMGAVQTQSGTGTNNGTQVTPDANTGTNGGGTVDNNGGTATTPDANTNTQNGTGNNAATNNGGTTNNGGAAANNGGATNNGGTANNGGSTAGGQTANKIDKEALAMFRKAAKDIHENGVAGYHKVNQQEIVEIDVGGNDKLKDLIAGFLNPGDSVSEKGSDDAKNRMPISDCSESYFQSVSKVEQGGNYVITIVMKDQLNPSYNDPDGLQKMSRDFLDMKDVHETVKTNTAVKLLVKELTTGEMNYKAYTIVATMTKDGKFVNIKHSCDAELTAVAKLTIGPTINGSGILRFTTEFSDFKY